jgi:non-heme chloroperoxidase
MGRLCSSRETTTNTVPTAIVRAMFGIQEKNPAVTQLVTGPGRGHPQTIDHGWREGAGL